MRERKTNERVTCAKKDTYHFSDVGSNLVRRGKRRERERKEKKKEKKREMKKIRLRRSTFSLDFMEIRLSVFLGARGKVHLRNENFTWVQEFKVFPKL